MRNAIINAGSKNEDVLAALTGTWNETDIQGWHVVRTPFFVALSGSLQAGSHTLPCTFSMPVGGTAVDTNGNVTGFVVRPGDKAVKLEQAAVVQLLAFGSQCTFRL